MKNFDIHVKRENTNAEKYTLRKRLFNSEDVLPMWVADMDIKSPTCVAKAIQKRATHEIYGYEELPQSAYEAQIEWIQKRHNHTLKREDLFYSHSVVASINVAIKAFTCKGDKVIVQTPVYSPFYKSVANNEREVIYNPLKRDEEGVYRFDIDNLLSQIDEKTKLLLLCSPHNPVGRVWKKEELEQIARICLEHNIVVFADEIHSDLVYSGHKHIPFASLSKEIEQLCVTTYGVGKTFNLAGLATSTVSIPNEILREKFEYEYEAIHFAQGNIFGHVSFESAYKEGEVWLDNLLVHLEHNFKRLEALLVKHNNIITCSPCEGTYLAWLDCSKMGLNNSALRDFFVKEARLGLSPGLGFSKEGSKFMRLNFAVPTPLMDEALTRLDKALTAFNNA